jgi:hypothetical protein
VGVANGVGGAVAGSGVTVGRPGKGVSEGGGAGVSVGAGGGAIVLAGAALGAGGAGVALAGAALGVAGTGVAAAWLGIAVAVRPGAAALPPQPASAGSRASSASPSAAGRRRAQEKRIIVGGTLSCTDALPHRALTAAYGPRLIQRSGRAPGSANRAGLRRAGPHPA